MFNMNIRENQYVKVAVNVAVTMISTFLAYLATIYFCEPTFIINLKRLEIIGFLLLCTHIAILATRIKKLMDNKKAKIFLMRQTPSEKKELQYKLDYLKDEVTDLRKKYGDLNKSPASLEHQLFNDLFNQPTESPCSSMKSCGHDTTGYRRGTNRRSRGRNFA